VEAERRPATESGNSKKTSAASRDLGQVKDQLKQAIDTENVERVKALMMRNPELHRAPLGYAKNGPLTWVAECCVPWVPPSPRPPGWRRSADAGSPQR
jgi:hypothetical protein